MKSCNILVLMGCTGSGKTYIKNTLTQLTVNDINFVAPRQITTRSKRPDEKPYDYVWVDPTEYIELDSKNELTCKTYFNGNNYGTIINDLVWNEHIINIIVSNKEGYDNLCLFKEKYPDSVEIKTALVLSDINVDIANDRHRNEDIVKNEFNKLLTIPYDIYIPNYSSERITTLDLLNKIMIGFDQKSI